MYDFIFPSPQEDEKRLFSLNASETYSNLDIITKNMDFHGNRIWFVQNLGLWINFFL